MCATSERLASDVPCLLLVPDIHCVRVMQNDSVRLPLRWLPVESRTLHMVWLDPPLHHYTPPFCGMHPQNSCHATLVKLQKCSPSFPGHFRPSFNKGKR